MMGLICTSGDVAFNEITNTLGRSPSTYSPSCQCPSIKRLFTLKTMGAGLMTLERGALSTIAALTVSAVTMFTTVERKSRAVG